MDNTVRLRSSALWCAATAAAAVIGLLTLPTLAAGPSRLRPSDPAPQGGPTPHIHFKIGGPGFEPLTTVQGWILPAE